MGFEMHTSATFGVDAIDWLGLLSKAKGVKFMESTTETLYVSVAFDIDYGRAVEFANYILDVIRWHND